VQDDIVMRRLAVRLTITSVVLALLAGVGAFAWARYPWLFNPHYNLKLATGPLGSDGQRVAAAFAREIATEYPLVRLDPRATESLAASGKALKDGLVDLAVVRSDDEAAASGRTTFILRKVAVAVLLPPNSPIEAMGELVGKKVALVEPANPSDPLLKAVTGFYGIAAKDLVPVPAGQLFTVLRDKRAAAAIVLGPVGSGEIADAFGALRKGYKAKPTFLDIAEAEAIAERQPVYEALEIKAGSFGGAPPEPAEAINTVAMSIRLVARASLPDRVVGEITRLLIATKAKLLATVPAVGQMEAPDTEVSSTLPVHRGTLAYLNGEQQSLLDETLNYYWLGVMVLGILGPVGAFLVARMRRLKPDEGRRKLLLLIDLGARVKSAAPDELAALDEELDDLLEWSFDAMITGELDRDQFQCVERMIAQLRASLDRRQASLSPPGLPRLAASGRV
jgi:uncharacterized protein